MNDAKVRASASRGRVLSPPLRRFLRLSLHESSVQRMWQGIAARSPALAAPERRSWAPVWAGVVVAVLAVLGFVVLPEPSPAPRAEVLLTSDGLPFESLEAAAEDHARAVVLADGSRIEVSPGARVEGLASTPTELVLRVRHGRARFSVTPGGSRRWLIETSGARVEVVGTILSVDAAERAVRVDVEEGAVLVRSPWLPDAVRRLEAGHSLTLEPPEPSPALLPAPLPAEKLGSTPAEPAGVSVVKPSEAAKPAVSAPARQLRAATPRGEAAEPEQLWADADRARRAGEPAAAARLLERLIREHPKGSQAALAAFTLGALYVDELAQPERAARVFREALALGIPAALRDTCYLRWAESARAVGDVAGVRGAVEEYAQKFPTGEKLPALRALLDEAMRVK